MRKFLAISKKEKEFINSERLHLKINNFMQNEPRKFLAISKKEKEFINSEILHLKINNFMQNEPRIFLSLKDKKDELFEVFQSDTQQSFTYIELPKNYIKIRKFNYIFNTRQKFYLILFYNICEE